MDGDIENGRAYPARRRSSVNDGIQAVTEEMDHLRSGGALLSAREVGACCRKRAGDPLCEKPGNGMAGDPDADLSAAACEMG